MKNNIIFILFYIFIFISISTIFVYAENIKYDYEGMTFEIPDNYEKTNIDIGDNTHIIFSDYTENSIIEFLVEKFSDNLLIYNSDLDSINNDNDKKEFLNSVQNEFIKNQKENYNSILNEHYEDYYNMIFDYLHNIYPDEKEDTIDSYISENMKDIMNTIIETIKIEKCELIKLTEKKYNAIYIKASYVDFYGQKKYSYYYLIPNKDIKYSLFFSDKVSNNIRQVFLESISIDIEKQEVFNISNSVIKYIVLAIMGTVVIIIKNSNKSNTNIKFKNNDINLIEDDNNFQIGKEINNCNYDDEFYDVINDKQRLIRIISGQEVINELIYIGQKIPNSSRIIEDYYDFIDYIVFLYPDIEKYYKDTNN